jgi:hypothetical protein
MSADPLTRAAELTLQLRTVCTRIVESIDELAPLMEEAVALDAQRRAALAQDGRHEHRPPVAEQLVEVLHGRLGCLRPYVPFVTAESAERVAETLLCQDAPPEVES